MTSIISNYSVLHELWDWSLGNCTVTEMKARIRGVQVHMQQFEFFFGLVLGRNLLQHTDSLSVCLQRKSLSEAEGQALAAMTIRTLKNMRADDKFALFWKDVTTPAENNLVNAPMMPRRRRLPARYEDGDAPAEFDETPESRYTHVYFEALDKLTMSITDRFDQHDYNIYMNCEGLLLKTANGEDATSQFDTVTEFYGSDFMPATLQGHLQTFGSNFRGDDYSHNGATLSEIVSYLQSLTPAQRDLMSEVITLVKLILVMPATNATSERSFSALRLVKTYLRSTMTQNRLNHLMVLTVHEERTDNLDLLDVANVFISGSEHRLYTFGVFKVLDRAHSQGLAKNKSTQTSANIDKV